METARRRAAGLLGALAIAMAANLALSFTGAYSAALRDALRATLPANGKAAQIVSSIAPRMMEMSQAIGAFVWLIEIGALVAVAAGLWRGWAWARIGGMVLALVGILVLGLMVVTYAVTPAEVAVPLPLVASLPRSAAIPASAGLVLAGIGMYLVALVTLARMPEATPS